MATESNIKKIMSLLKTIMFDVETVPTASYTNGIARLPKDRQWSLFTYPNGRDGLPEVPYIGGEKYIIVENKAVLGELVLVLANKFKNIRCEVISVDNEYFNVRFYSVEPDKITTEFYSPVVTFENSYNGKVKAKAKAGLYRVTANGEKSFLNNGSVHYEFKHHSSEGNFALAKISEKIDEMLKEFNDIESKIQKLKKIDVNDSIGDFMLSIVPNSKTFPKKAVSLAVDHISMETVLFDTRPNLWLVYTALATAIKKHEGKMEMYQRETADSMAWENILQYAKIK